MGRPSRFGSPQYWCDPTVPENYPMEQHSDYSMSPLSLRNLVQDQCQVCHAPDCDQCHLELVALANLYAPRLLVPCQPNRFVHQNNTIVTVFKSWRLVNKIHGWVRGGDTQVRSSPFCWGDILAPSLIYCFSIRILNVFCKARKANSIQISKQESKALSLFGNCSKQTNL